MTIGVIYAKSLNNAIGLNQQLPWHLPEDLKHFKEATRNSVVAMGRKTWESLPFRPLPHRVNVVLTTSEEEIDNAVVCRSVLQAVNEARYRVQDIWFIGGASVIEKSLEIADRVWVTEILNDYVGDTFVADLPDDFKEISRTPHVSATGVAFNIIKYERK